MSEMVERVKRASFKCWRDRMDVLGHHLDRSKAFEDMNDSEKEFAELHARAVIAEMREPTGRMKDAGVETYGIGNAAIGFLPLSVVHGQPTKSWQAMIDAALEDK